MFRIAKKFEQRFLLSADHVVSLTHAALREMKLFPYLQGKMPPFTVITTCADLTRFVPMSCKPAKESFTMGYVGSAGTWYHFEAVAACFAQLRRMQPNARFLIVNRGEHPYIRECLNTAGVPETAVELVTANHTEIPQLMARMDAGIFFIKPVFSKLASAPTKLGEFLGCGIPCLSNTGVGDMADILEGEHIGIALSSFDEDSLTIGLHRLMILVTDATTHDRCIASAKRHFSLDVGVTLYSQIYVQLEE